MRGGSGSDCDREGTLARNEEGNIYSWCNCQLIIILTVRREQLQTCTLLHSVSL